MAPQAPPRWLQVVLRALLTDREERAALGDLHEEWIRTRDERGRHRANLRYALQGFGLLLYRGRRLVGPASAARVDLRIALRTHLRRPLLLGTALLALAPALALTGFAAALGWVVLVRPLPHPEPSRLAVVEHSWEGFGTTGISSPLYRFYADNARSIERLGVVTWTHVGIASGDAQPVRIPAARMTSDVLSLLGARPLQGRLFGPEEDGPGARRVALVTHGLWQDLFGGEPDVVGRSITVEGVDVEVVGILAPGLELPGGEAEIVLPASIDPGDLALLDIEWWYALARLAPGADADAARRELDGLLERAVTESPDGTTTLAGLERNGIGPVVTPLKAWLVGPARDFVLLLLSAIVLLFVLALAAVTNLLVGRSEARTGELALRRALGAGLGRLTGHLGAEAVVLCGVVGSAGTVGAWLVTRFLLGSSALDLPRTDVLGIPATAAGIAAVLALLLVPLFALLPLIQTRSASVHGAGSRVTALPGTRKVLLGAQVAVSTVLLVAALALGASVRSLIERPLGFRAEGVLTFSVSLPGAGYPDPADARSFHDRVVETLQAAPGVVSVGYADGLPVPMAPWGGAMVRLEGEADDGSPPTHQWGYISEGFLETVGVPFLAGRGLTAADAADGRRVVVVNEAFARLHWDDPTAALGREILRRDARYEIVGVVGNTAGDGAWGDMDAPILYAPRSESPWNMRYAAYVVRTSVPPAPVAATARRTVAEVDPGIALFDVGTLSGEVRGTRAREELALGGIGLSGGVALVVVAASLVGLLLLSLARRRREIGVRKAVGAGDRELRWLLLRGVLGPSLLGVVVGAAAVLGGLRFPDSLLHGGVGGASPLLPTAAAMLLFVAVAGYWASRRIGDVDPSEALRAE